MRIFRHRLALPALIALLVFGVVIVFAPTFISRAEFRQSEDNYIVVFQPKLRIDTQQLLNHGHKILRDLSKANMLVVRSSNRDDLATLPGVKSIARDTFTLAMPDEKPTTFTRNESLSSTDSSTTSQGCATTQKACPLQWDLALMNIPQAWQKTQGSAKVRVANLDTGLLSTHEAVGMNYDRDHSRSFVETSSSCNKTDDPSSLEDFDGHGTWTATHIAGKDGPQISGIAPSTTLINVRVLNACGSGALSWLLDGMYYANSVGAQIINMSMGTYICADGVISGSARCGNQEDIGNDEATWDAFARMVDYLKQNGTTVIAAAGNDHVQLDRNGRVISAGSLPSGDGESRADLRGTRMVPAGVPGVVAVSAVNRATGTGDTSTTRYGQYGSSKREQLAYYSNYGPRIDLSAPGGARNYNVPSSDCISKECSRLEASSSLIGASDNSGVFGAYGTDSNGQSCNNCYAYLQGTSTAAPQVAGVAALALAAHPDMTPTELVSWLHQSVSKFADPNATPPLPTDSNSTYYSATLDYKASPISNNEMGTGIIDAASAVSTSDQYQPQYQPQNQGQDQSQNQSTNQQQQNQAPAQGQDTPSSPPPATLPQGQLPNTSQTQFP
ncbi:S8 family serine peptidase [Ktedonobacter racemifer]|uniref:Peptidase S8 and S53 subtilisin kexin sedolisin n=1 Tax=Ktedonobacter racemifer DSM 44963 TaxID=485913 RepID=D6TZ55_KTERA|nr:S8 family serine peptidase [Ktedonobacter racemifer]EFH81845.1 peptidase S8 and S53 subtilisin kexin sedolisin [Ktedonobacter racemifer DSM 44963]